MYYDVEALSKWGRPIAGVCGAKMKIQGHCSTHKMKVGEMTNRKQLYTNYKQTVNKSPQMGCAGDTKGNSGWSPRSVNEPKPLIL